MVVLNKIYTRTGDDGSTSLGTGARVPKFALRVAAYGTVDETNAAIGVAVAHLGDADSSLRARLVRIQNDLFDLGADLCAPEAAEPAARARLRITEAQVKRLEDEIDDMNAGLKPLRSFVLPGGSPAAASLHVARTVCRRAERLIVELSQQPDEPVGATALKFVNRLSDYLFVASRHANGQGTGDVLWVPGQNR
jgi:cob(I)alamin adenosyltransferase